MSVGAGSEPGFERRAHWDAMYRSRADTEVSWFEADPKTSLELIAGTCVDPTSAIIDVGGGASRLVDTLVLVGYKDVTVIDLSEAALAVACARLDDAAAQVAWIAADITTWLPSRRYQLWHDRAAFHFLIDPADRTAYIERMTEALVPGGYAVIGTFAPDGPQRCSNLPVERYDAVRLSAALGSAFQLLDTRLHRHRTPGGAVQNFQFSVLRRKPSGDAAS
jgi:SAM-dependent methyltransferase